MFKQWFRSLILSDFFSDLSVQIRPYESQLLPHWNTERYSFRGRHHFSFCIVIKELPEAYQKCAVAHPPIRNPFAVIEGPKGLILITDSSDWLRNTTAKTFFLDQSYRPPN